MAQKAKDEEATIIFGGTANAANCPMLLESFCTMLHMSKSTSNIPKDCISSNITSRLSLAYNADRDTTVTGSTARRTDSRPGGKSTATGDADDHNTGSTLDLNSKKMAGCELANQKKGKSPTKKASKKGPKKLPPSKKKVIADPCWQTKETIEIRALTEEDDIMHA